jgi:hypothetical protein
MEEQSTSFCIRHPLKLEFIEVAEHPLELKNMTM